MKITKIDENTVEGITQCTPSPPPPFYWCMRVGGGGGIKHPTKFLKKKGGLAEFQFLEVVARKQRGDFFQRELQFLHKR